MIDAAISEKVHRSPAGAARMAVSLYSAAERARMKSDGALLSHDGHDTLRGDRENSWLLEECGRTGGIVPLAFGWLYNSLSEGEYSRSNRSVDSLIEDAEQPLYFGGFLHYALHGMLLLQDIDRDSVKWGYDFAKMPRLHWGWEERYTVIHFLLEQGIDVNRRDSLGRTALHYACFPSEVDQLLKAGADIDASDGRGRTALMHSVKYAIDSEDEDDPDGSTRTELTHHLVLRGADVTLRCHMNLDAEYWAVANHHLASTKLLRNVRRAGCWKSYLNAECVELATLRSLCRRGLLAPPNGLQCLFCKPLPDAIFQDIVLKFAYGSSPDFFKYDFKCLARDLWKCSSDRHDYDSWEENICYISADKAERFRFLMGFPDDDAWRALPRQRGRS
jgi:hypothetical protein